MLTGYTQPGITLAVRNLEEHQLITVRGTKEKYIHFNLQGKELWMHALKDGKLSTPVLKRIYVDAKPDNTPLLRANATALPEYSDMNPDAQEYFAVDNGPMTYMLINAIKEQQVMIESLRQEIDTTKSILTPCRRNWISLLHSSK